MRIIIESWTPGVKVRLIDIWLKIKNIFSVKKESYVKLLHEDACSSKKQRDR